MAPSGPQFDCDEEQCSEATQPESLEYVQSTALYIQKALDELGFRNTFSIENNQLYCSQNEQRYPPEKVRLLGAFRFEGISDPTDMSIIYALETDDGTRGTIVDAFGPKASVKVAEFMEDVVDDRENSELKNLEQEREIFIKMS